MYLQMAGAVNVWALKEPELSEEYLSSVYFPAESSVIVR